MNTAWVRNINYLKSILFDAIYDYEEKQREQSKVAYEIQLWKLLVSSMKQIKYETLGEELISVIPLMTLFENEINLDTYMSDLHAIATEVNNYKISNYHTNAERNYHYEMKNRYKQIILKFNAILEQKKSKLNDIEKRYDFDYIKAYRAILSNLKYGQLINYEQLLLIKNLLEKLDMQSESVKIIESVKIRNTEIKEKKGIEVKFDTNSKYDILNLLNLGYEKFENIDNQFQNGIVQSRFNTVVSLFKDYDRSIADLKTIENSLPKFDEKIFTIKSYKYLYFMVMKWIQDKMFNDIEPIKEPNIYFDLECKKSILKDFRKVFALYKMIRTYFDNEIDNYKKISNEGEPEIEEQETISKCNIYFLKSDMGKVYFERDLKLVPSESLEDVKYLLGRMNNGTLSSKHIKPLTYYPSHFELKKDSIRIILKSESGTDVVVKGIFVKKCNCAKDNLDSICKRKGTYDIDSLETEKVYTKIIESVNK